MEFVIGFIAGGVLLLIGVFVGNALAERAQDRIWERAKDDSGS